MSAGALYAVTGEAGWIYYGQVTPEKRVGFFRRRDRKPSAVDDVLAAPIMAVISVAYPSIMRAVRNGQWQKLGRFSVVRELVAPRPAFMHLIRRQAMIQDQGQADVRIEITPAMIEAGKHAARNHHLGSDLEAMAWEVYLVMETERKSSDESLRLV